MTVIAYREGIMAADSRAWSGGHSPIGSKTKIRRLADGTLIGCSSSIPGAAEYVMAWYEDGMNEDDKLPQSFTFLAVKPDGTAMVADDGPYMSGPLTADYFAIGSGRQFALGALAMNATAEEAVQVGIELDTCSAGPIQTLKHK